MIPLGIVAAAARRASPGTQQTLLSAVNIGTNVAVTMGGTAAEGRATGGTSGVAISVAGKTAGKFYAEVHCTEQYTGSQALAAGLHRGTAGLNTYLGGDANGWATWNDGGGALERSTYHNAVRGNIVAAGATALGQRCRIAVDLDNGRVWLAYFGATGWVGGGDPAAGTSPTFTFTPGGASYHLALNPRGGQASGVSVTRLVLVSPDAWENAPPAGFGVWLG